MLDSARWSGTLATRSSASTTDRYRSRFGELNRRRSGRDRAWVRRADPRAGRGTVGPIESAARGHTTARAFVWSLHRRAVDVYDPALPGLRHPVRSALVGRRSGIPRRRARALVVCAVVLCP